MKPEIKILNGAVRIWRSTRLLPAVGVLLACAQLTGCTVIGASIGSIVDAAKKPHENIVPEQLSRRENGRKITVVKTDSSAVEGKFQKVDFAPINEYALRYANWAGSRRNTPTVPLYGDTIFLTMKAGRVISGLLLGFDRAGTKEGAVPRVWTTDHKLGISRYENLADVSVFQGGPGQDFDVGKMSDLVEANNLPLLSCVYLVSDSAVQKYIPLDKINRVMVHSDQTSVTLVGTLVGLALDITYTILAITQKGIFD